jgi:hypothetical protein
MRNHLIRALALILIATGAVSAMAAETATIGEIQKRSRWLFGMLSNEASLKGVEFEVKGTFQQYYGMEIVYGAFIEDGGQQLQCNLAFTPQSLASLQALQKGAAVTAKGRFSFMFNETPVLENCTLAQ